MSIKQLVKTWALPDRTQERQQLTLRLNFDTYAKLHALKEIYPTRSVNDMINDILTNGLDEIIEALPSHPIDHAEAEELAHYHGGVVQDYMGGRTGPSIFFQSAYSKILNQKVENETNEEAA